ncbi:FAD-dependent oxidoreductase [Sphingobacterium humi]|uniref:FAD-dependent oxidoreductase n=1 Tax=Sphingobacterium humi TaxID=1796905 RepID=A0A6N8KY21_9SPHI|nr:FAD-dependent oxidoreductase [Sphingobacterium humi]MVZ60492.1 FAD-dependent oxidoreductase [Sphingobacterium humi]
MKKRWICMLLLFGFSYTLQAETKPTYTADLIIYGGTSAAMTAAVEASQVGLEVIVVSPDKHLGGLSSGGLGFTDTGNKAVIGGLAREFYHQIYLHYDQPAAWTWQQKSEYGNKGQGTPAVDGTNRTMWIFEPHAAEQVFENWIKKYQIKLFREEWLDRSAGAVLKNGTAIQSFKTLSGKTFQGKMFIDATYEGDLMAAAGVSYHVGREANAKYQEKWNGVQVGVLHHGHWFKSNIDPYRVPGDKNSGLLFGVSAEDPGQYGQEDARLQAYCFRLCLTDNPQNRVAFRKPKNYNPKDYELLARVYDSGWRETFDKFDPIPNKKTDTNNHGPFSMDFIGMNYDYPEASYAERKKIIKAHQDYQQGLLYFMANDPRMPADVRTEVAKWGLAKDEFKDNQHWPHQLYIREARRMVGAYVMTEHDTFSDREVNNPIGMGSYTLDSHNVQRYVKPDGYVQNEGDIGVHPKKPYKIAYGAIIPKANECSNLLVPVCVSSSHIAFGSIRMEPVFMILGQSAAAAANLAIKENTSVQQVDYNKLKEDLLKKQQVLDL